MNWLRLFHRDVVYYRRPFACLSAAACLACAILVSALMIGDSVRGTLYDNLNRNTSFAETLLRFSRPARTELPGGVLHARGYIAPGIKAHLYAFPESPGYPESPATHRIAGRDAYCNRSLAGKLGLKEGDTFSVRVQTYAAFRDDAPIGLPPKLKRVSLIYRGEFPDERSDANFDTPQLATDNLFLNHDFLTQTLGIETGAVNEIWTPPGRRETTVPDETVWDLSRLYFDDWHGRPVLKSYDFYVPERIPDLFPGAKRGVATFAESLSDGKNTLDYFFVGAFEGDIFPVEKDRAVLSDTVPTHFEGEAVLTCFQADSLQGVSRRAIVIPRVFKAPDANMDAVLMPEIPGLTDVSNCSHWEAGVPVDFDKVRDGDEEYWKRYRSKPKLYMNFEQARESFSPGRCNVLVFEKGSDTRLVKRKIVTALRDGPPLYRTENVFETLRSNIDNGIPFAPLFLGLSFFIIVSALLVLSMLLQLHWFDRRRELETLENYTACRRRLVFFHLIELIAVLVPGIVAGLFLGVLLCRFQLFLLENVWNGIIGMERLNFHFRWRSCLAAFGATFLCSLIVILHALRTAKRGVETFCFSRSRPPRSLFGLATLSFFRCLGHNRACMVLLILGFLGTLGVGAFGIKSRGEDGFSYEYIAETALPVVASHDAPFPPGALPVRVFEADAADCSNVLRAKTPTVYGCDTGRLTGDPSFLDDFSAAADAGSLTWIMKKKLGDTVSYSRGSVTLRRAMKASVFQGGILVNDTTFEQLFPGTRGARFFLIRDRDDVQAWRTRLEPYGATISTTNDFMARAEHFQNRYLAIFLQLATLGFLLGIGSLLLLLVRNVRSRRNETRFMYEIGFSRRSLFRLRYYENLWLYLSCAVFSLAVLGPLAIVASLHLATLLSGWCFLTGIGILAIYVTLKIMREPDGIAA